MVTKTGWREVEPFPEMNGALASVLDTVDTLRTAWEDHLRNVSAEEFNDSRRRSLRRHAIETGIIERLYDVDWGVTEALVAEGLTVEAASAEGGINDGTLDVIRSQFDALEFLADAARIGRDLSVHFVRELHQAITRHQDTFDCRDTLGRLTRAPLRHGEWKQLPNHVTRHDGSVLEYTPPEHVPAEMDRLVRLYHASAGQHPIARAAWLHHRFIRIHPFSDGNGRVARALVLLVLLGANYAPLVVDRRERATYIDALDTANDGDLRPLVRLFARLEIVALRSELERPAVVSAPSSGAVTVARAYVDRLLDLRKGDDTQKARQTSELASTMQKRISGYLESQCADLRDTFAVIDPQASANVDTASPTGERAHYWRAQLLHAANQVDFYTNLSNGSWWVRLHLRVYGQILRYITAVQKVGQGETGVLAQTAYAEILPQRDSDDDRPQPQRLLDVTPSDSVTLVYSDAAADRWEESRELIDRTLAAAVDKFAQRLG